MVGYSTATESSRMHREAKLLAQKTEVWDSLFHTFGCSADEIVDQKLKLNLILSTHELARSKHEIESEVPQGCSLESGS